MLKKFKFKLKKNIEIIGLILLILSTALITIYFNHNKNLNSESYNNFINNIYLKKTLNHIINDLEPKYIKYNHIQNI